MYLIVQFLIFYGYLYLVGRGFSKLIFKNNINNKLFLVFKFNNFYVVFSLILIGNISFLVNFFIPVTNLIFLTVTLIFISFNFYKIEKIKFPKLDFKFLLKTSLFVVLPLSSYSTGLSYDATLYHLLNQLWIKSSVLNIGLSNFHVRYGYSSIYEYISANFWLLDNYIFLHFLSLCFLIFFFTNVIDLFFQDKNYKLRSAAILIAIFGFLDNFGFNGGKNGFFEIEGITQYDSSFGLIFSSTVLFIYISTFIKKIDKNEISVITLFSLFLVQLRPSGYLIALPILIFTIYNWETLYKLVFKNMILKGSIILYLFWIFKNILVSGCIIFPVEFSCISSLDWYDTGYAELESQNIGYSLKSLGWFYSQGGESLIEWYTICDLKNAYNVSNLKYFSIALIFCFLIQKIFYKKVFKLNFQTLLFILSNIFFIIFWLFTAPDFRFAIGFLSSIILIIPLLSDEVRNIYSKNYTVYFFTLIFTFSLVFILRVENYTQFISEPIKIIDYSIQDLQLLDSDYEKRDTGYGVQRIDKSEQCVLNLECTPAYSLPVKIDKLGHYNLFLRQKN